MRVGQEDDYEWATEKTKAQEGSQGDDCCEKMQLGRVVVIYQCCKRDVKVFSPSLCDDDVDVDVMTIRIPHLPGKVARERGGAGSG